MTYKLLITGSPGVGKTYILTKVAERFSLPGVVTLDIREKGFRVGFKAVDLKTKEEKVLAHKKIDGIRFGRYFVDPKTPEWMISKVLQIRTDLPVILDEIGPMELISERFKSGVHELLSKRSVIASVHRNFAREYSKKYELPLIYMKDREDQKKVMELVEQWLF